MKVAISPILLRALIITGRFGFISRDVFWKHVSRNQKSENYANWNRLLSSGFFKLYESSPEHLYLSRSGVQVLQETNNDFVGKAHPMYFAHDELVMRVAIACQNAELILPDWTCDAVVRRLANVDRVRLLGGSSDKIPDLIFDLNVKGSSTRVAFEVERSRKSKTRYDALVLSYMQMRRIGFVVIAYNDRYTETQIRNSMRKLGYPQNIRPIAFCKIGEVNEAPRSFPILFNGNVITFDRFVINLRQLELDEEPRHLQMGPEKSPESSPEKFPAKRTA